MTLHTLTRRTTRQVATLHPDTSVSLQIALLDAIDEVLRREGADRIWIDRGSRALIVVAEVD